MKKGLILEGGAMRGMFTCGILDVVMENGIEFDGIIGVSAGAAFGCNYISKQPGRAIRYNMKYCRDKRFCSVNSLIKTGNIFGAEFAYHTLPDELDIFDRNTFENNKTEFYVCATDIKTGKAVYHKCKKGDYEDLEWIRASASMPFVSVPVEIGGYKMLDGGFSDAVPVRFFESIGYDRNIVILTRPDGYVKKKDSSIPLARYTFRKFPKALKTFEQHHIVYNDTLKYIKKKEKNGEILVIRPEKKLEIGRIEHNPGNLKKIYDIGRNLANRELQKVISFLNKA